MTVKTTSHRNVIDCLRKLYFDIEVSDGKSVNTSKHASSILLVVFFVVNTRNLISIDFFMKEINRTFSERNALYFLMLHQKKNVSRQFFTFVLLELQKQWKFRRRFSFIRNRLSIGFFNVLEFHFHSVDVCWLSIFQLVCCIANINFVCFSFIYLLACRCRDINNLMPIKQCIPNDI